jgi:excisionase family DNA binding protein
MSIRETVRPDSPAWLDLWQASEYLNIPESTIRRWIKEGAIPYVKPGGRPKSRIRIWSGHLDELMERGYRPARTGPLADGGMGVG